MVKMIESIEIVNTEMLNEQYNGLSQTFQNVALTFYKAYLFLYMYILFCKAVLKSIANVSKYFGKYLDHNSVLHKHHPFISFRKISFESYFVNSIFKFANYANNSLVLLYLISCIEIVYCVLLSCFFVLICNIPGPFLFFKGVFMMTFLENIGVLNLELFRRFIF